jgi:hypothetical protein
MRVRSPRNDRGSQRAAEGFKGGFVPAARAAYSGAAYKNAFVGLMLRFITAHSVGYLSAEGMHRAAWGKPSAAEAGACDACFTGEDPVPLRT